MSAGVAEFARQVTACKRARIAASSGLRDARPAAWWAGTVVKGLLTLTLLGGALGAGLLTSRARSESTSDWQAIAPALVYPAVVFWTWLLICAGEADPLSRGLTYGSLGRRRRAALLLVNGMLDRSTALLFTLGLLPWLALTALDGNPLPPAGWAGIAAMLAGMAAWRQVTRAAHQSALGMTANAGAAVRSAAMAGSSLLSSLAAAHLLHLVHGASMAGGLEGWLARGDTSAFFAAVAIGSLAGSMLILSGGFPAVRSALAGPVARAARFMPAGHTWALHHPTMAVAGMRMQALRMSRDANLYLGLGAVVVARIAESSVGGLLSLEAVTVFVTTSAFYNLYGDQAPHFGAWLLAGQPLGEWTKSLLAVQLLRAAIAWGLALAVACLPGTVDVARLGSICFVAVVSLALALCAGPAVSRRMPVPSRLRGGRFAGGAGYLVGSLAASTVGMAIIALEGELLVSTRFALAAGLVTVVVVGRPWQVRWTPDVVERFHRAFLPAART